MRSSALKKKANDLNDPLAIKLSKKSNYIVNLSRKTKKDYFQKHMPHGSSSKNVWKFCKPFFTNQITNFDDKIMLVENEKVVSKHEEIEYFFNTNFNDFIKGLNIERRQCSNFPYEDLLVNALTKYEMHPSILKIKSAFTSI